MRVAITGSHGFVGGHLSEAIQGIPGLNITRLDRRVHNLAQVESIRPFEAGQDIIFHLAGANRASSCELLMVNTVGTLNLLEAIERYGRGARLVFLSSFQVYRPSQDLRPMDEGWPLEPASVYGISKLAAERLINISGVKSLIFRASNIYGPRCRPYYNSVIATFLHLAVKGEPLIIEGSGHQARDFIYVGDVVTALLRALTLDWDGVKIFNLCSGTLTSINELVRAIEEVSGKPVASVHRHPTGVGEERGLFLGDNTRAKKELSWSPETGLLEGLRETYQWFLMEGG